MLTLRTVFLTLHAASGLLGLIVGLLALRLPQPNDSRQWFPRIYAGTLVSLAVFLIATVAIDWSGISGTQRVIYAVLIGLAAVMVTRIFLGVRLAVTRPAGWQQKYLNHVYFTYISLWAGFFIVGLIDLGAPGWLVAAVAIGVVVVGAATFNNYKRRVITA